MVEVRKFVREDKEIWNTFISNAKNATFLFYRDYMDYHADRFEDHSLMIFKKNKLQAVVPACINKENKLISHSGLTYGGIVIGKDIRLNLYLKIYSAINNFLKLEGINQWDLKLLPDFYTELPSQECQYALFLDEAQRKRVDTALVICQKSKLKYQNRRKRSINNAKKAEFKVLKDGDFESFWNIILSPNLMERFGVRPVHSLKEIEFLAEKFPENISQVNIYENNEIIAGCTVYETNTVAHAQYISANDYGRKSGALDLLFDVMINDLFSHKEYFDFGICNERSGKALNGGLLDWKEGFGGRTYVHEFYQLNTSNTKALQCVVRNE